MNGIGKQSIANDLLSRTADVDIGFSAVSVFD